jgi:hypothetical protein
VTDYIHKGSQALEFPGQCRVAPSLEGTPFSAELDPDVERSLIAAGQIVLATAPEVSVASVLEVEPEELNARKGRR